MRDAPNNLCAVQKRRDRPGGSLAEPQSPAAPRCAAPNPTPDTRNPVPASPSAAHSSQLTAHSCEAFTLIELIVVVVIISLLLAIALPVSTGLLNSQKAKATLMTMQTLDSAMGTFASERPIADPHNCLRGEAMIRRPYGEIFGPFPPSPVTAYALDSGHADFAVRGPTGFTTGEYRFAVDPGTKKKFEELVRYYLAPSVDIPEWHYNADNSWFKTDHPETDKYLSIETLVLFLRQLSPASRRTIERMQKHLTNKDRDTIEWDSDGLMGGGITATDLFEITDAWGNPLRYAVQSPVVDPGTGQRLKIRWELRSAGPDGKFRPTFNMNPSAGPVDGAFLSEEDAGDDVILRGP